MLNETTYRAIYDEYLESGLTVHNFCLNQHMNEAKFYYWQNKLRSFLPPKRGFVPVVFDKNQFFQPSTGAASVQSRPSSGRTGNSIETVSCEIVYPNGVSLKLNGRTDLQTLHSLLMLAR
jgi:hypothetical protein